MKKKDFEIVLARLEELNALRVKNGKLPLKRFWTGVAHRLHTGVPIGEPGHYWVTGFFTKDEELAAVIEVLIEVERGTNDNPNKKVEPLRVFDFSKFVAASFGRYNSFNRPGYQLGDVVIKPIPAYDSYNMPEIGVIIQTHEDGDFRTDKFGNGSNSEVRPATLAEITQWRKDLLPDLLP